MVDPEEISLPELSDKAHEIGKRLAALEPNDQQAWGLVIDPTAQMQNPRALSRQICTAGTGAEELQTGRKYLFSIGRTDKLFGETPNDLINGCIRAEGGGPKAFNVF
jgi:hypothetical protein